MTITLWTYWCNDNTVRTRCDRHIITAGPYAINRRRPIVRKEEYQPAHRCVACYLAYLDVANHALEDDSEEI